MGRRGRPDTGPDGLVVVDKPAGWTSHDVVAKSRGLLGTRKVGHAGTLDPDATGVLLLGVGRATKLLRFLSPLGKAYVGDVALGTETTTLDAAGDVTATYDMSAVTFAQIEAAAGRFVGPIQQIPPMVSAVKIDGRRLHELAREGIEIDRPPRSVTVHSLTVLPGPADEPGVFTVAVECSSGTYIRTLAADIGHALGGGAHLRTLRRTAVGPYTLADAVPLEAVAPDVVRPMTEAVRHLPTVVVDDDLVAAVAVGAVLDRDAFGLDPAPAGDDPDADPDDGPWAVIDSAGDLRAVYQPFRGRTLKPALVIPPRTAPPAEPTGSPAP